MDSGNSGSLQSSSGGEEEYDSRAESISAFLNHHPSTAAAGCRHHHPSPPHLSQPLQQQQHHSSMFDPLSNYFDPLSSSSSRSSLPPFTASSSNPNSLLNLDMVWSKGLRSEPNCTDLGGFFIASSLSPSAAFSSTQQHFTSHSALQSRTTAAASSFPAATGLHIPRGTAECAAPRASVSGLNNDQTNIIISNNHHHNNNNNNGNSLNMVRNPKKRSRASRRAPTTVLTTDTTNFRAMVQEFTGIPAAPFTSSPFPRTRLDLFGTSGSSLRSTPIHLDSSQPSYLLRPFAQKINPIPFVSPSPSSAASSSSFSSSSMIDAIASSAGNNIASGSATAASNNIHSNSNSTSINYQLPSDLGGLLKQQQPQNLLNINMQNPILNLQSLFQAPQKYPLNSPILETKPQGSLDIIPSNDSHLKIGVLDEIGLSHPAGGSHHHRLNASLGGLQNIVSSEAATLPIRSDHQNNPTTWPSSSTDGTGSNENDQGLLRSISSSTGNYNSSQRVVNTNGKVINNFMASSSSDFHRHNHRDMRGQAAAENVTTRSEGMVESWICSSD